MDRWTKLYIRSGLFRRERSFEDVPSAITGCEQAIVSDHQQCVLVCGTRHDLSARQGMATVLRHRYLPSEKAVVFRSTEEVNRSWCGFGWHSHRWMIQTLSRSRCDQEFQIMGSSCETAAGQVVHRGNGEGSWREVCSVVRRFKGNLTSLIEMTHWEGSNVLYIGDHIYGDLAVCVCKQRRKIEWKLVCSGSISQAWMENGSYSRRSRSTCGCFIVLKICLRMSFIGQDEINISNSDGFQKTIRWVRRDRIDERRTSSFHSNSSMFFSGSLINCK